MSANEQARQNSNPREEVAELRAQLAEAKALLKEVEFGSCDDCGIRNYCLFCSAEVYQFDDSDDPIETQVHAPDCRLAKVLK